jgi:3-hydroxyacyl-CoA dehydrogenase / enoyl-CoA hydratase / 3-hydroxybutyryl-CoA epimerase
MALAVRAPAGLLTQTATATTSGTTLSARTDAGGVVWLELADAGGTPRLDSRLLGDLLAALELAEARAEAGEVQGLVLSSASPRVFVAGTDFAELRRVHDLEVAAALVELGQEVSERLFAFPVRTAAWIRGACIGSGVGLASACDLRLVADSPVTRISLPEAQYGLMPGLGCCARLPALVGFEAALGLVVYNHAWDAAEAERLGFADRRLPAASGEAEVSAALENTKPRSNRLRLLERGPLLRRKARRVTRGAGARNPGAAAAVRTLVAGATRSRRTALAHERELLPGLLLRPETANRIHLAGAVRARGRAELPSGIHELGVVGAGEVAADLLARAAQAGVQLLHHAPQRSTRQAVATSVAERLRHAVESGRLRESEADAAWQRLREARGFGGFGMADAALVLADVPEPGRLRQHLRPEAILLTEIAAARSPEPSPEPAAWFRLLPELSPSRVVELFSGGAARDAAHALLRQLGFLTVPIGSPGGLWEPLARRLAFEAGGALDSGVDAGELEAAALEFGMAIGPLRLADELGLDHAVPEGERAPYCVAALLERGRAGRHAGAGFYDYSRGSTPELSEPLIPTALGRATWLAICNRLRGEAEELLAAGVGERRTDVDLISVLTLGFPVERGGLLHDGRTALDSRASAS